MSTNNLSKAPIVVIGAGVAGLAAANLLAHQGLPVRVFEVNDKVGGCCATTTIDGYTFNDGALFLGIIGLLDHVFARLGLDRHELLPLRKISANSSIELPDGTVIALGEGFDIGVKGRAVDMIRLQGELRRMVEKWQPVLHFASEELLTHPFSPWRALQKGWRHLHKLRGTVASECNRLFSDNAVKSALSGTLLYSGLPAERMPVSTILGLVSTLTEGLYLPEGGMRMVPEVLNRALGNRRVPVLLNTRIGKIIIENGRACGVQVKDGERVDAAGVISTASGMLTFGSMIDKKHVPHAIQRRLTRVRLSHQSVSLQLGLSNKIDTPAHNISVLPWMEHQREIFQQDGSEPKFPVYSAPTRTLPELATEGGSITRCSVRRQHRSNVRVDGQKLNRRRPYRTSGQLTAKSIIHQRAKRRFSDCARKVTELTPEGLLTYSFSGALRMACSRWSTALLSLVRRPDMAAAVRNSFSASATWPSCRCALPK